jgi:hypothetical protein
MAVASTLAGAITVTKHNDAALPTNDPGILVNTATQLKVTLGTASVGTTTVSMSMSGTDGGCTFCQTAGGTYATTKTQTIADSVAFTDAMYVKCTTGHATGASIVVTVSGASVNSYTTLTHTAMAVATTCVAGSFSTISTTGAGVTGTYKYYGAAVVGTKVYLAPYNQNNVGVVDTTNNAFSTISTTAYQSYEGKQCTSSAGFAAAPLSALATTNPEVCKTACSDSSACTGFVHVLSGSYAVNCYFRAGVMSTPASWSSDTRTCFIKESLTGSAKYSAAVVVGTKVYFAPVNVDNVGVLDTTNNAFSTISTTGVTGTYKYDGAAVVGTKVYFAPLYQDNVGVLDTTNNAFSTISTTAAGVSGGNKYVGAAAVGTKVYFCPFDHDTVGILDTTNNAFSAISTTGAGVTGGAKYWGAAVVGTKVYFVPGMQDNVGVLDTTNNEFSTISITLTADYKYCGAVVVGTKVYFLPYSQDNVGVLDTTNNAFTTISTAGAGVTADEKYSAGVLVGTKVYFGPYNENNVGVLAVTCLTFTVTDKDGGALPTNDPGMLVATAQRLKIALSTASVGVTTVTMSMSSTDGGCVFSQDNAGDAYATTKTQTIGAGLVETMDMYIKCASSHATGASIVVTQSSVTANSYTTLTHTVMAVASTLAGSITVTTHDDAALPTNDPGILVNTAQQLKITLGYASIGVTTVSISISGTDGGCMFCQTAGGTYATTKTQTIANGQTSTTDMFIKCATAHATGASIVVTVSGASVNSYNTLTHTAMAVATTLSGSITVTQGNDNALATNAAGVHKDVYHPLKVNLVGGVSKGTTTVTLSRDGANGNCRFAATDGGGLATSLSVTFSDGDSDSTAAWVMCDADHATGAKISGTQAASSQVNRYTSAFTAVTAMAVFSTTFAPTTVPKRSSGTTTVTITLSSGTWSSNTDRIKIVGASDANCAGATICGHVVVSGGSAGPPGVRTAGFTCATAVKDGKICYSNDAGTR